MYVSPFKTIHTLRLFITYSSPTNVLLFGPVLHVTHPHQRHFEILYSTTTISKQRDKRGNGTIVQLQNKISSSTQHR